MSTIAYFFFVFWFFFLLFFLFFLVESRFWLSGSRTAVAVAIVGDPPVADGRTAMAMAVDAVIDGPLPLSEDSKALLGSTSMFAVAVAVHQPFDLASSHLACLPLWTK